MDEPALAAHCALLMRHLGIERAHVVGHSSSAVIALQLALDFPDAVHMLALMKPARPVPPTEEQAAFVRDFVAPAMQRYRAGDKAGAVDTFARGVFGSGYRGPLEQGFPGLFEQAVADADAFFAQEQPALQQWLFTHGVRDSPFTVRPRRRLNLPRDGRRKGDALPEAFGRELGDPRWGRAIRGSTRTEDHTSSPSWCSQFEAAMSASVTAGCAEHWDVRALNKTTANPARTKMHPCTHRPKLGGVGDA
jgi:pimeloyl-ACP methyl ester carboxylesterase